MADRPPFLKLSCAVQTYAWGKVGLAGEVAKLKNTDPGFSVEEEQPYAELWMGTHVKGPSVVAHPRELSGQLLSDWLKNNQWALGERVAKEFSAQLPFLFKVLSINKALSIQAHPTKSHAKQLHSSAPDKYPDPNHKPELIIALEEFEGFCGFRPFEEIQRFVSTVPELQAIAGSENTDMFTRVSATASVEERKEALKVVFTAAMTCDSEVTRAQLEGLVQRAERGTGCSDLPSQERSLLTRLHGQFPGDIGCFCVFFLNFLRLQPGESLFLAPNEPHAYLYGEVLECMACSDNVVRAGLTPKYRDKDTLCKMLTYITKTPSENKFRSQPHPGSPNVVIYDPPTPEFSVAKITIPSGTNEFILPVTTGMFGQIGLL